MKTDELADKIPMYVDMSDGYRYCLRIHKRFNPETDKYYWDAVYSNKVLADEWYNNEGETLYDAMLKAYEWVQEFKAL